MKLSEAIRLGSMLHPQCFGSLEKYKPIIEVNDSGTVVTAGYRTTTIGTCAIGAAQKAGLNTDECDIEIPIHLIPRGLRSLYVGYHSIYLLRCIVDLNDKYKWTREAIADWVETVEKYFEAQSVEPVEPVKEEVLIEVAK